MKWILKSCAYLVTPTVPQTPLFIIIRGSLLWLHGTAATGAYLSVTKDDDIAIRILPYNCGLSTIGTFFGLPLCYALPSIHVACILFSKGIHTTWRCTGMEYVYGPLNATTPQQHEERSSSLMHATWGNRSPAMPVIIDPDSDVHEMKKLRDDLWRKILDQREGNTPSQ